MKGNVQLLVEAKLEAPRIRRGLVVRPRIGEALRAGSDSSLTLVAAPAGYGKTTAVRAWFETAGAAVAWVTLDGGDNDPARLWRYVATAIDRVRSGLGRAALQRLRVPGGSIEDVVDELMNAMATYERGLTIVLDDLHAVTDEECLSSIDRALRNAPATVRFVVSTRVDPSLGLARLRAAGQLVEVRARELAFTPAEAHELLVARGGVDLRSNDIEALVERTEGWPAALVLAGLWLRTVDDPAEAVSAFRGDQRFVADYLTTEVLASLDADRRSFLHGAAVLGEFTADLCDAVLERADSALELAELERANLFVSRLERGEWFRMHSLFAEYARAQLASFDPDAPTKIHRLAAEWLRDRQLPLDAIEHAAAARAHDLVADLLVEQHLALIRNGAGGTLLRWIRTLPDESLVAHPELAAAAATATMLMGANTIEQRRFLALAERTLEGRQALVDPYVETAVRLVRAITLEGGVRRAVLDGRRAVELAREGSPEILTGALAACAQALYFAGDVREASAVARRALEHPDISRAIPSQVVAHAACAFAAAERGELASARGHAEKARAAAGGIGSSRSWLGGSASAALGAVLAAEGRLAEAERELGIAEQLLRDDVATVRHTWLLALLARVRARRGRLDQAEVALRAAREALGELPDSGIVPAVLDDTARELETARARAESGEVLELPTAAELAVLRLLATDLTIREIGERLYLSANTIRTHTRVLYRKLGVHSRADAIARATALGLLEQAESSR